MKPTQNETDAQPGPKKHVFISHSSVDNVVGQRLCDWLESKGVSCWFSSRPTNLDPGSEWDDSIVEALNNSAAVVLLFSKDANASRWVKRELAMASSRGLTLLPIRLDDSPPTGGIEAYLTTVQWTVLKPSDWDGSLKYVVRRLRTKLGHAEMALPPEEERERAKGTAEPQQRSTWSITTKVTAAGVVALLAAAFVFSFSVEGIQMMKRIVSGNRATPPISLPTQETTTIRLCVGEYRQNCSSPYDVYLGCGADIDAWARSKMCEKFSITKVSDRPGNRCGYAMINVLCTRTVQQ